MYLYFMVWSPVPGCYLISDPRWYHACRRWPNTGNSLWYVWHAIQDLLGCILTSHGCRGIMLKIVKQWNLINRVLKRP